MINVEVRDAEGALLHTYQIIADEYGTLVKAEHVLEMVKLNAIEDGLASKDRVDELSFIIVD